MKTAVMLMAVVALLAATAGTAGAEAPDHAQNDDAGETAPPEHAQNDDAGETAPPEHAEDEHADDAGETAPPEHAQDEHADDAGETAPPEHAQNDGAGEAAPPAHANNDGAGETGPPAHAQNDGAGETGPPAHAQNERSGHVDEADDRERNERNESADAPKVTLCHATGSATNPFVEITVSANAITKQGHDDHQDGRDIIPPFDGYEGLNWDDDGQATFNNGCGAVDDDTDVRDDDDTNVRDNDNAKVTLCHATGSATNPYVKITVSTNAVTKEGHSTHQDGRDIIPPFEGFDGLNWDAEGRAFFDADCEVDDEDETEDVVVDDEDDTQDVVVDDEDDTQDVVVDDEDETEDVVVDDEDEAEDVVVDDETDVRGDEVTQDETDVRGDEVTQDETDVRGDEVVNVPVLTERQTTNVPVQPVVRPVSTITDTGPEVLGATVQRGALARTGSGSSLMLAPFGLSLVLLGFALRRSSRRAQLHMR